MKFKDYEVFDILSLQMFDKDLSLFESLFSENEKIQKEAIIVDQIIKDVAKELIEKKKIEAAPSEENSLETSVDQKTSSVKKQSRSNDTPGSEPKKRSNPRPSQRANPNKNRVKLKTAKSTNNESKKKKPGKEDENKAPPKENVASFITSRSKKDPDSLNYNLRGEIKQNSKLEFDKKIYETNNPKRNREKATIEVPRTAEE